NVAELRNKLQTLSESDSKLVGMGNNEEDKTINSNVNKIMSLSEEHSVVITGEAGVGKTTLLYLVGKTLLESHKSVLYINDVEIFPLTDFKELGQDYYAIVDLTMQNNVKKILSRLMKLVGKPIIPRLIISARKEYSNTEGMTSEEKERLNSIVRFYQLSYDRSVLLEITKRLIGNNIKISEKNINKVVDKAEGLAIYIVEAVKLISISKGDVDNVVDRLPDGIEKLIFSILEEEMKSGEGGNNKAVFVSYYLISHYQHFPKELLSKITAILVCKSPVFINIEGDAVSIHSWYKDVIDKILKAHYCGLSTSDNTPSDKEILNMIENLPEPLSQVFNGFTDLNNIKENVKKRVPESLCILEFNLNDIINVADATILLALTKLIADKVKKRNGNRYGFNILGERINYNSIATGSLEFYTKIVSFTFNSFLSKDSVTEILSSESICERPFFFLSSVLMSRILDNDFARNVEKMFITSDLKPTVDHFYATTFDFAKDHIMLKYLASITLLLEKLGYFYEEISLDKIAKILHCELEYDEAQKKFGAAIAIDPNYANYHYGRGIALSNLKLYEEALKEFGNAITIDPNYASYHNNRGNALYNLKRYEEALEEYNVSIAIDPNNANYHNNRGNALSDLKRYEEALKELEVAIAIDPNYASYHNNRGSALSDLKRYEEALKEFEVAIAIDPNDANYHYGRGIVLSNLKRYEDAIEEFAKAIKIDPEDIYAYLNKSKCLFYLKRYKEAKQEIELTKKYSNRFNDDEINKDIESLSTEIFDAMQSSKVSK
ncbi:MAG: tetratricopeptide repeat protein, partial [Thermoplasmataceae archaeon]